MPPRTRKTEANAQALKELQQISGIGPSLALDLYDLGLRRIADLKFQDPQRLYDRLNALRGVRQDPCVLYTFRCAVYFATEPKPDPSRLNWWTWKDEAVSTAWRNLQTSR